MLFSKIEYIFLRLLRRKFFSNEFLEKFGSLIPYYFKNCNQSSPEVIVNKYQDCANKNSILLDGKVVIELGPGVTNSTCYELAAKGCARVYAYEPYAAFNSKLDNKLLNTISERYGVPVKEISGNVMRIDTLDYPGKGEADLIFSHSVLEHVQNPQFLFATLLHILSDNGVMINVVDYRDHFFKYPYHILLFSKKTWKSWLDPGDLPGWRLHDHLDILKSTGYQTSVDNITKDRLRFNKIRDYISDDYNRSDPMLAILLCTIISRKKHGTK